MASRSFLPALFKTTIVLLFLLVAVGGNIYIYQQNQPCVKPITYHIASVDPRFHISMAKVATLADNAATVWNAALGKELFVDNATGSIPISLVYDDRQAMADNHKVLETQIANQKKSLNAINSDYSTLLKEYKAYKVSYEKDVEYWNARGGAPADVYAQLEKQRQLLNSYTARLNTLSKEGQTQVAQVNQQITQYNAVGGKKFEGGVYESDAQGNQTITIYEFENALDLEYVIAHEMGHALGLDHVVDPEAVMSAEHLGATVSGVTLTSADKTELERVCGGIK